MKCPQCNAPACLCHQPCPNCNFSGNLVQVENLAHINWLLNEVESWSELKIPPATVDTLHKTYINRRNQLEIALGLRLPPFTEKEAVSAWPQCLNRAMLIKAIVSWYEADYLHHNPSQAIIKEVEAEIAEFTERLKPHPRPAYPTTDAERLMATNFLLSALPRLESANVFVSDSAKAEIEAQLTQQQHTLEIALGLRQPVVKAEPVAPEPEPEPEPAVDLPPPEPKIPLGERIWRTLLSERTLQAILFLGIFLLLAAALSFVIWGWKNFSAPLRIAIPISFTAGFFILGRVIRKNPVTYRSGLALSAIAALLIPIDFYTLYANTPIPDHFAPAFWLLSSLVCVFAYSIAAYLIKSRIFGYLVTIAAGSTVLAVIQVGHDTAGLSLAWQSTGLMLVALGLIISAHFIEASASAIDNRHRAFIDPFRYVALLGASVLMALTLGQWLVSYFPYNSFYTAMAFTWLLGSVIMAWGAIFYQSRGLGMISATTLPVAVFFLQNALGFNPAWYAIGFALLAPLYFSFGYRWLNNSHSSIIREHGLTAVRWGVALMGVAAIWSLAFISHNGATTVSHLILAGTALLVARLWRQARFLLAVSIFSFSSLTAFLSMLGLAYSQFTPAWAMLGLLNIFAAVYLGKKESTAGFAWPLVWAGYAIAALALLPAIIPYNGFMLIYGLGNWLALSAWGAWLANHKRAGFTAPQKIDRAIFDWATAIPLPIWLLLIFAEVQPLDNRFALALTVLAWGMVGLSYRYKPAACDRPWHVMGLISALIALVFIALSPLDGLISPLTLALSGALFMVDGFINRQRWFLAFAATIITCGWLFFLTIQLNLPFEIILLAQALLIATYFALGLGIERWKKPAIDLNFLQPLYTAGHVLNGLIIFILLLSQLPNENKEGLIWGSITFLILSLVYVAFAWGRYGKGWAHLAVWLGVFSAGFMAMAFSQGRGSSAAKAGLLALGLVLLERGLRWLWRKTDSRFSQRRRALVRLGWWLFCQPLLVAGGSLAAGTVGLALIRNIMFINTPTAIFWAWVAMLIITTLFALSAWVYRQPASLWLAGISLFASWTILAGQGWYLFDKPQNPAYAISWLVLAYLLYGFYLLLQKRNLPTYALHLQVMAHLLAPLALLWGLTSIWVGCIALGLAIGFYTLNLVVTQIYYRQGNSLSLAEQTLFLYPTLFLLPLWAIYLMTWLWPAVGVQHYGLLLLVFGPLGMLNAERLKHLAATQQDRWAYMLPSYLVGYGAVIVGTLLLLESPALLAMALLYTAVLCVISAWRFKNPIWIYIAVALAPIALALSLYEVSAPLNRAGWWFLGLATLYLALAWALRRAKLKAYSYAPLLAGVGLIFISLPPSSLDQIGAIGGYAGAVALLVVVAIWFKQPLWLWPACALSIVPYTVLIDRLGLLEDMLGLALLPLALIALFIAWLLDKFTGKPANDLLDIILIPFSQIASLVNLLIEKLTRVKTITSLKSTPLQWWGLPLYLLSLGTAILSLLITFIGSDALLMALNLLAFSAILAWGVYYFRWRLWLLGAVASLHLAILFLFEVWGWWDTLAQGWLAFSPVVWLTALSALWIARRFNEGSPFEPGRLWAGWSRPLWLLIAFELFIIQISGFGPTTSAALLTLSNVLLLALVASVWRLKWLPYVCTILGVIAWLEWIFSMPASGSDAGYGLAAMMALLSVIYGFAGYSLSLAQLRLPHNSPLTPELALWEKPLKISSLVLSGLVLAVTAFMSMEIVGWVFRSLFGPSLAQLVNPALIYMIIQIFAMLGLLYLLTALVERKRRLAYLALAMMVSAWLLYAFFIQSWDNLRNLQYYALPVGLYLLGISYLEYQLGNKTLARWIDYTALALMIGSLFWQTLAFGWLYFILLIAQGLALMWWGSARRLRRFLYAGMAGVVLATAGQLGNVAFSFVNQWVVFGLIGLFLVLGAIVVERKLDQLRAWQNSLEMWE